MKDRLLKKRSPLLLCMLAGLCCLFLSCLILSCRGNGGSSYSDGAVYTPGGASGGSGSAGGSAVTAEDLWTLSNAGSIDRIVELFQTGFTGGSCTVVISAADLGLPAGGTVTLTITGPGINYTADAAAGADGNVTFEVPLLETKTTVTVGLTVRDANGTVLYIGSEEQEVGADGNLHVGLVRQFWTLPAGLTVTASPDGLVYDVAALTTASVTFSISGLEGAPAAAVFTYEWEDADNPGTAAGTGATLTKTLSDLLGGTVPAGDVTRTFSVTVSYTDAGGTTATASGSAGVVIGGPVTLPDFVISIGKPSGATGTASPYGLANLTSSFTLTAQGATFPTGTSFVWTVNGTTLSATGASASFSPGDLGLTDGSIGRTSALPTSFSISCTAKNPHAADLPKSASVSAYLPYSMPTFTIQISAPSSARTDASGAYVLANLSDSFTITAPGTFPPDTTFLWTIGDIILENETPNQSISLTPAQLGITAANPGSAASPITSQILGCRATNVNARPTQKLGGNPKITAYYSPPPVIPDFTVQLTSTTYSASYGYYPTDTFTFTAATTSGSFPGGTTFDWEVTGPTGTRAAETLTVPTWTKTASDFVAEPGEPSAPSTSYTFKCTAKLGGAADVVRTYTLNISP